jgi:AraC-like DNA-binding protein
MNHSRHLTVNYPNIPVIANHKDIVYGQFVPTPPDLKNTFSPSMAAVKSMDMYLNNFSLRMMEGEFYEDAMLVNTDGDGSELLGSCLFLKGRVKSLLKGESDGVDSFQRQQNFKYDPDNEFVHIVPSQKPFHFLHFSYTPEFLYSFLPEGEAWSDQLRDRIIARRRIVGERAVEITSLQDRALQTIFDNPLKGKLGLMMLETAMVQIILLQLNGLFKDCPVTANHGLHRRDMEIIHAVKEHLLDTYLDDHSLSGLALHFGINTNKLMNSFKKMFGKSIFEFIQDLRMQYAQRLLKEDALQVMEVARTVGYKNPNHFSAAFKRQFGVCPSELR